MSRPTALWLSRARGRSWAALREDGQIVALDVEDSSDRIGRGRIARGRVVHVTHGAGFVDLGNNGTGWLEPGATLRAGQTIAVQVRRVARRDKLAELTRRIQLVGRYLVLDATRSTRAVSRRVKDDRTRDRLTTLVERLDAPSGGGWIVRAPSVAVEERTVRDEALRLLERWREIAGGGLEAGPPAVLHREPDLLESALRDAPPSDQLEEIVVDDLELREAILERLAAAPDLTGRMRFVPGAGRLYEEEIHAAVIEALAPRVPLSSGGTLTIEETTALVSIDVDSGSGAPAQANVEAAREIPRQLRLRDLGGAIVVDWVSVRDRTSIEHCVATLASQLERDTARTRIVGLSDLELLEMTRERQGPGLSSILEIECQECGGKGRVLAPDRT